MIDFEREIKQFSAVVNRHRRDRSVIGVDWYRIMRDRYDRNVSCRAISLSLVKEGK